ncbi:DinB family protein [Streptomyces bohaiensis]|uniref:DinB family protein n=1 Tax=Streptomyces bohaiensis TaxID=1431344 RepID=A0ABX1CB05_9ACTN|nr:DinB family protein [Streptomyces bohaiensis]NJQ14422.1 DinB family protein [Streptomyces bohaiensis]
MPTVVRPEARGDERGALLSYLDAQRGGLRRAVYGLTHEQATSTPTPSVLSVAGLLKHVTVGEQDWITTMSGHPADPRDPATRRRWEDSFALGPDETVPGVLVLSDEVARRTEEIVRALPSLDDTFDQPSAPWDPGGTRSWRWGLLHLIEEAARHAGHADIIREAVDGKGAFQLVFETGAAPEPDWSMLDQ